MGGEEALHAIGNTNKLKDFCLLVLNMQKSKKGEKYLVEMISYKIGVAISIVKFSVLPMIMIPLVIMGHRQNTM